jgi:hypothetical protein
MLIGKYIYQFAYIIPFNPMVNHRVDSELRIYIFGILLATLYKTTVRRIEESTGYDFLSYVPKNVQYIIENE